MLHQLREGTLPCCISLERERYHGSTASQPGTTLWGTLPCFFPRSKKTRFANPHHVGADPDPATHPNEADLRPSVYRAFTAPFRTSQPPLWASTVLCGSIWASTAHEFLLWSGSGSCFWLWCGYGFVSAYMIFIVFHWYCYNQSCGSMTCWCGSGSADPCLWLMDPDSDPAIFVIDLQDANKKLIFFKVLITFWRHIYIIFQR